MVSLKFGNLLTPVATTVATIKNQKVMNKQTRTKLEKYYDQLNEIVAAIREIGESEQEKYDNAPENLQDSNRVMAWAECADSIELVCDELDSTVEQLMDEVLSVY